jgi:hypothetical protein
MRFNIRDYPKTPQVKKSAIIRAACIRVIRVPLQRNQKDQPKLLGSPFFIRLIIYIPPLK